MERVEKAAYQGAYSIDVSESDCGTDCQGQFTAQGYTVTVDTGIVTIDWA